MLTDIQSALQWGVDPEEPYQSTLCRLFYMSCCGEKRRTSIREGSSRREYHLEGGLLWWEVQSV